MQCSCEFNYQVILQRSNGDIQNVQRIIKTQRVSCQNSVRFDTLSSGTYAITVFLESPDGEISPELYFGMEFSAAPTDTTTSNVFLNSPNLRKMTNLLIFHLFLSERDTKPTAI